MAAPRRGKMMAFRLSIDAEQKFIEIHEHRISMNMNAAKCDILSQAIDLLYQKELGQWKPKVSNGK